MKDDVLSIDDAAMNSGEASMSGQALVEYSLIILLIIIACLVSLAAFQDVVVNHLYALVEILTEAM